MTISAFYAFRQINCSTATPATTSNPAAPVPLHCFIFCAPFSASIHLIESEVPKQAAKQQCLCIFVCCHSCCFVLRTARSAIVTVNLIHTHMYHIYVCVCVCNKHMNGNDGHTLLRPRSREQLYRFPTCYTISYVPQCICIND